MIEGIVAFIHAVFFGLSIHWFEFFVDAMAVLACWSFYFVASLISYSPFWSRSSLSSSLRVGEARQPVVSGEMGSMILLDTTAMRDNTSLVVETHGGHVSTGILKTIQEISSRWRECQRGGYHTR